MSKPSSFAQIQNKPLRERVLDSLRHAIVNGELKPGDPIVETELAAQMGVSRAPLREAINILNVEGLLDTVPYHGTTVKQLLRNDIEDLYSVRSMMEIFAVRRLIESGKAAATADLLNVLCEEMASASKNNSLSDVNRLDREFHSALIEQCGNEMLITFWNSVTLRVQQVMSLSNELKGDLEQITRNHLDIVDAIANENIGHASTLVETHIQASGEAIAAKWEEIINTQADPNS